MKNQPRSQKEEVKKKRSKPVWKQKWQLLTAKLPIAKWQSFQNGLPQYLSFVFFLLFWALIYIGNRHSTERRVKQNYRLSEDVKELRSEYLSIKADLMFLSKQSEIAKLVKNQGLKEITKPPFKVEVSKRKKKEN